MGRQNRFMIMIALLLVSSLTLSGCSLLKQTKEYARQEFLMDTVISITAYGENEAQLKKAVDSAYEEMNRIALRTDRFAKPDTPAYEASEICRINEEAGKKPVRVSDDVYNMIELSLKYYKMSGGVFDITIGPLMDLWGFGKSSQPHVPSDAQIKEKLPLVDSSQVILNQEQHTVYLAKPQMSLDLGGIAKGYAARNAGEVLKQMGVKQALINAGGNIVVIGKKDDQEPWKIGIQDPRDPENIVGVLSLVDETSATSGDYQRNFTENGVLYHHILSPKTGKPARDTWSVTVVTKNPGISDGLTTTLFVLGPDEGLKFLKNFPGVEAFYVGADKKIRVSPGLKDQVTVEAGEKYLYDEKR